MMRIFFIFLVILFLCTAAMGALKNEDCLECHGDYKNYSHGAVACASCHKDIAEVPHQEKLQKPQCEQCHRDSQVMFDKSVHGRQGMKCKECHAVHYLNKEKKYCASCHGDVEHTSLPVKELHMSKLQCAACHASVSASTINVSVSISSDKPIKNIPLDADRNGIVDQREWSFTRAFLEQNYKGKYKINKKFIVKADVHGVTGSPRECGDCHIERKMFSKAKLTNIGSATYDVAADPKIFIEEIPPIARYKETVHGKRGVGCADCHVGQEKIGDAVCMECHKDLFNLYKYSEHGTKNAARCTDCHNPHRIKSYRELNAQERIAICARCHKDYVNSHSWLPHTALHFHYLECGTCHSPESKKSMLFNFAKRTQKGESDLTYDELKRLLPAGSEISRELDQNSDRMLSADELSSFFLVLRQKLGKQVYIDGSILVTEVHHNFTVTRHHEKQCTACHSKDAPFYASMYLVIPEKEGRLYVPVKDTTLSALPIALAMDMTLLGEEKLRGQDLKMLFTGGSDPRRLIVSNLGLKWIDLAGIVLVVLTFCFVGLHVFLRVVTKK